MKLPNEVKVGVLGIVAIAVFVFGYNYLKGKGVFASKRTITAVYQNVGGLQPANRINYNGFDVGTVTDIYLTNTEDITEGITVEMAIDKSVNIPKDSRALIFSDGLLGTKAVKLELGKSTEYVNSGESITGGVEYGLFDKVGQEVDPIINDLRHTLASLDTAVSGIKNIVDASTQTNVKNAVANLNNTTEAFSDFAATLSNQRKKIDEVITNINGFTVNLNKQNGTINRTLGNLETTTANLSKVKLEETVTKLDKTLSALQTTLSKVNSGDGTMAKLMNDAELYNNLKNTSETLNNLLYDLSARPYRYVNLNLIGGKKKASPPLKAPNAEK